MKNIIKILFALVVCCSLSNLTIAQGTIGEYPGAGVGFDAGCGYLNAGNSDPGVTDVGLTGNVCGAVFDVTFGPWIENTTATGGFDISGFELNNYDIDTEATYGIRLFYGPQNNCCTICLDAMLDLSQDAACATFGPQASLASFGYTIPANYGQDIFGSPVIPYEDMCPNTEYFAQYQFILATEVDLSDPDGNFCAMDDALLTNFGTQSTVQTLVAPGVRDALVINSSSLAVAAGTDCMSAEILLDFSLDVTAGCTVSFGTCSQGLDFQFQSTLACGTTFDSGTILNDDPSPCLVGIAGMPFTGQISLGNGQSVCDILACDPAATIDVYAFFDFCEADDLNGDGTGNDEDLFTIDLATVLAGIDCTNCAVCAITPDPATNIVCDDNGTPFDASDDTFTFDILVNGSNTNAGASGTFNDDQGNAGIAYGTIVSYGPYPIAGGAITVNFTDVDDPMCIASMMATPPATCSDAVCSITPDMATNIVCNDNGTPADPADDTFTFDINVNGSNTATGASNTFNDDQGNIGIAYGTTVSYGPFPISGGPITVTFTDADAPAGVSCTATMMATPPATCSGAMCTITPDMAANIVCNDNGTPADPSDDTFTFDITVNGSSTFPGATNTFNDDQGNAGIAYGTTVSYGPFPIAGGNITVMFTDADEATCTGMMMAAAPATCSGSECTITPDAAANIVCDDNGTPADSSDDTFTFDITVNGSSTFPGATNTFNDSEGGTGISYGTTVSYGPFPISGGNVTIMFTDADEASCTGMMMAAAPATCSAVCEDSIMGSVSTDDPMCSPDFIDFSGISVTIIDVATGLEVDGSPVLTDAMGNYTLPGPFACGQYSAELDADTLPTCYVSLEGGTGPITFNVNGDGNPDGANFNNIVQIPTLSQWGLMSLALLLMIFGALKLGTANIPSFRIRKN